MSDFADSAGVSRRTLLAVAGGLAGCSAVGSGGTQSAAASTPLEIENERIVTQFCLDWASRDANALANYLADDVVYQMFEGRPDIVGRAEFIKQLDGFLNGLVAVEWEILRSYAIGELVINERIDHFIAKDEKRSMHFAIAGFFLVRDGKIKIWKDYSLPGGISQVGSAVPRS